MFAKRIPRERPATLLSRAAVAAIVAIGCAALSQIGCTSKSCTTLGCLQGARLTRDITVTDSETQTLAIRVCRNTTCADGTKASSPNPYSLSFAFSGPLPASAYVAQKAGGGHEITVNAAQTDAELPNLKDGDVYTVTVTKPGAPSPILEFTGPATYTTSEPNGPGCGICKSVEL